MNLRNRVLIEGFLISDSSLRNTPAGIPVIEGRILHQSSQMQLGSARKIECEIPFLALGDIAQAIANLAPEQKLKCKGFLAAKSQRFRHALVLHIDAFELLN
ncbi:primosomal replication protein N [Deefgea sp. CFH1-16]|uniref:primosomal replication protein N n=1 Tax=Deefgea sp. CFH1-16 TaxID=2675457 RepID=UPI001E14EA25|nr:primosomal replication protein N [Deefgea sp. CFH1-16]MBM5573094.1 primosomal replication protein N [Deefgea sp. CFH1-16]